MEKDGGEERMMNRYIMEQIERVCSDGHLLTASPLQPPIIGRHPLAIFVPSPREPLGEPLNNIVYRPHMLALN